MAITNKIRFGVVGTNFITDWVIAGARQDERFELVAVYSRTQETADAFAARHQIPYTFTSLGEITPYRPQPVQILTYGTEVRSQRRFHRLHQRHIVFPGSLDHLPRLPYIRSKRLLT